MTTLDDKPPTPSQEHGGGPGSHSWMMIACCIPMLVIAVVLVGTGVAGAGAMVGAIMCIAMVWMMMMRGMAGSRGH